MSRKDKCTYPAVALSLITNHLAPNSNGREGSISKGKNKGQHPRNTQVSAGHPHNTHCRARDSVVEFSWASVHEMAINKIYFNDAHAKF